MKVKSAQYHYKYLVLKSLAVTPMYVCVVLSSVDVTSALVTSTDDNTTQTYIGVTANDFKTRYRNHLKSLRNEKYKHETELSKHVWNLKKENRQFSIRWAIVKQLPAGTNGKRNCTLCLEEKLMIMKGRSKNILNRRSEMFSKCRHVI